MRELNLKDIEAISELYINAKNRDIRGYKIPKTTKPGNTFEDELKGLLSSYLTFIENKPSFQKHSDLIEDINNTIQQVQNAIQLNRQGQSNKSVECIEHIIKKYYKNPFIISEIDKSFAFRANAYIPDLPQYGSFDNKLANYPLSFYRCRKGRHTKIESMLHSPLSKTKLYSAGRFNIPDVTCLYLGVTSYSCWKEIHCPDEYSISAYRLTETGKKLKVINLVLTQAILDGIISNVYTELNDFQKELLGFFPLVLSTCYCIPDENNNDKHHPEYILSNLIMRCIKNLKIDGIAYISTKNESEFDFPQGVNLAIPIFENNINLEYGSICQNFEITLPQIVKCNKLEKKSNDKFESFINHVFGSDQNESITYKDNIIPYKATNFSKIDNCLVSQEFTKIDNNILLNETYGQPQ